MDDTKREELEKACKNYKVRTRMVAVRMVRVLNMSVEETASILVHCPTWVRDWLRRYDEDLRDLPRCGRPRRITRDAMDAIVANVAGCRITPVGCSNTYERRPARASTSRTSGRSCACTTCLQR